MCVFIPVFAEELKEAAPIDFVLARITARSGRKMNEEMEATRIPLHDVPVALVVQEMTREKMAVSLAYSSSR